VKLPTHERLALLNQGNIETKNLMEALSIDFSILISTAFPDLKLPDFPEKTGIVQKMKHTALYLYEKKGWDALDSLKIHPSDTLRGVSCYIIAHHPNTVAEKFQHINTLANDTHFGVREWAWLALRQDVIDNLDLSFEILTPWTQDPSENIRRFACELTRPRGVWCAHIKSLRQAPWKALHLLESLKNDPARYVQLSLGNWLNDAGKDHPEWIKELCKKWQEESSSPHTIKICKRGLRNFK